MVHRLIRQEEQAYEFEHVPSGNTEANREPYKSKVDACHQVRALLKCGSSGTVTLQMLSILPMEPERAHNSSYATGEASFTKSCWPGIQQLDEAGFVAALGGRRTPERGCFYSWIAPLRPPPGVRR